MPSRRAILTGLAAGAAAPRLAWADLPAAYLAAARQPDGRFALHGLRAGGLSAFSLPLPGRGHAAAAHPRQALAVFMARRPGNFALVVDCGAGNVLRRLRAPTNRHFYGHAAFSADGATLWTTENAFETGEGVVGIWAADSWRRIGEAPSGGIGPHEIIRRPQGGLAVANGGIRTHPATGREKLNLGMMRPNLAFLSAAGEITETIELDKDLRQNSIRHLAAAPDGAIAFAMQWEGDPFDAPPLLGLAGARGVHLYEAPLSEQRRLAAYAGGVAMNQAGDRIAITAPRGGRAHIFDRATGALVAEILAPDISGVAVAGAGFMATTGLGQTLAITEMGVEPGEAYDRAWDNHLITIA